jgi:hypothetical protein
MFLGPFIVRRSPCGQGEDFIRNTSKTVSQAWLDQWRRRLPETHWVITGDSGAVAIDIDGTPDANWRRKDILIWLKEYDAKPKGYATKTQLLDIVDALMNPERVDEVEDIGSDEEPEEVLEEVSDEITLDIIDGE